MRGQRNFQISTLARMYLAVVLANLAAGCATSGTSTPSAAPSALSKPSFGAQGRHTTVEVVNIIQPGGAGSWSADARWTEIVVRITNFSDVPLVGQEINLVSLTGATHRAVEDPLALADMRQHLQRSKDRVDTTANLANQALSSAATAAPAASRSAAPRVESITSSMKKMTDAVHQEQIRALANRAHALEREVGRRALALDAQLAPREHIQGSVFFTFTPSPKKLVVGYMARGAPHTVEVMLASTGNDQRGMSGPLTAAPGLAAPVLNDPAATGVSSGVLTRTQPVPAGLPRAEAIAGRADGDLLYTMKPGDTLTSISARLTGRVEDLARDRRV